MMDQIHAVSRPSLVSEVAKRVKLPANQWISGAPKPSVHIHMPNRFRPVRGPKLTSKFPGTVKLP